MVVVVVVVVEVVVVIGNNGSGGVDGWKGSVTSGWTGGEEVLGQWHVQQS